jgi:hypothetical protein
MEEDLEEQRICPVESQSKLRIGIEISVYTGVRVDPIIRAIEMAISSVDHASLIMLSYKKVGL